MKVASRAWNYFKPGVGVNPDTGLHKAGLYWPYFTDWDLGTYITSILYAEELGLIPKEGEWGADYRINKVIDFLLNRKLSERGLPYLWYKSSDGEPYTSKETNVYDTGKLLVALYLLKLHRPELSDVIDYIVLNRTNYKIFALQKSPWNSKYSLYVYYAAVGFSLFGFDNYTNIREALNIPDNILSAPKVETYGVEVPKANLIVEPLLHIIFDLPYNEKIMKIMDYIYLAHEARFNETGKYTAFSEGNTGLDDPSYIYEYVSTASGDTWVLSAPGKGRVYITPVVFYKVALGFKAIYNTTYSNLLTSYIEDFFNDYQFGIMDGVDEDGRLVSTIIDKTNALALSAAKYALINPCLEDYPQPFIYNKSVNNTLIVVGESKHRFKLDPAHTVDVISALSLLSGLGRYYSDGYVKVAIDGWIASIENDTIRLLDNDSNLIVVGSPGVNLVAYYYNITLGSKGMLPVTFHRGSDEYSNYIKVVDSGEVYKMEVRDGKVVSDYGVIMIIWDGHRYVLFVYGIGGDATRVGGEILRDHMSYGLWGRGVIYRYYDSDGDYILDSIEIIAHL